MEHNFPSQLRKLRPDSGLSQQQIGEMPGLKRVTISTWENGTSEPCFVDIAKLATIIGRSADELLGLPYDGPTKLPSWLAELMPRLLALGPEGRRAVKDLVNGLKE
jgi:transcriptional regulator with XRE-family HTH domain